MCLQPDLLVVDDDDYLDEPAVSFLSVPSKCAEQAEEFVRKVCRCCVCSNSWVCDSVSE